MSPQFCCLEVDVCFLEQRVVDRNESLFGEVNTFQYSGTENILYQLNLKSYVMTHLAVG